MNSSKCTAISACWGCSLKIRFRARAGVLGASIIVPRGRGKGQAAPTAFAAGGLLGGPGGARRAARGGGAAGFAYGCWSYRKHWGRGVYVFGLN